MKRSDNDQGRAMDHDASMNPSGSRHIPLNSLGSSIFFGSRDKAVTLRASGNSAPPTPRFRGRDGRV
jgi:hypothetical protein